VKLENVLVVPRSGNSKTGSIPVTYRTVETCPTDCPFLPTGEIGGCYGTGRIFGMTRKYAGETDVESATWKIRLDKDRSARYLRDRVVGDVVTPDGELDRDYVSGIAQVAAGNRLVAFGYTHAWRSFTPDDVAFLRDSGYVMNASTESEAGAQAALDAGMPAVIVDDDTPDGATVAGRRLMTCPAEVRDDVSCASCGLCAKPDRAVLIRFKTHGVARAKARRAAAAAKQVA
jgi:hypothetical protein